MTDELRLDIKLGHVLLDLSTGQLVVPLTVDGEIQLLAVPDEVLEKLDGTLKISYVPKGASP